MEGLRVAKADISAFLHPSWSGDVHQGVLQLLNSLLLRYNEEFDGVVLAYSGLKIFNRTAKILSGLSPYLCLKLTAKLLLFSPKPGMLLEGKVNKVEKDYIGVIVLGIINASIAFADIREEFSYQDNAEEIPIWVSTSDERHVIRIGSTIKFVVKSVQQESFLDMRGSLKPLNTGCAIWLSLPSEENSLILEEERKRHKKERSEKKRRKERLDAMVADGSVPTKEFVPDHHQQKEHKHQSKRKRSHMGTRKPSGNSLSNTAVNPLCNDNT